MAIIPKICITYESDASLIYIKDETGAWVDLLNINGYGVNVAGTPTPNFDRVDYAGVLLVYFHPYEGDKILLTTVTGVNSPFVDYNVGYTNTTESTFELPYYKDGWYEYHYTLVVVNTGAAVQPTPAEGVMIYSTSTSTLLQYDDVLALVTPYDLTVLENGNDYQTTYTNILVAAKLQIKRSELGLAYFECVQCVECSCKEKMDDIKHLEEGIRGAKGQFSIAPSIGQRMIEKLAKQYKTE
jgi:hypothetical protein